MAKSDEPNGNGVTHGRKPNYCFTVSDLRKSRDPEPQTKNDKIKYSIKICLTQLNSTLFRFYIRVIVIFNNYNKFIYLLQRNRRMLWRGSN